MTFLRIIYFLFFLAAALPAAVKVIPSATPAATPPQSPSRRVVVGATDVVSVRARIGFTTMLLLPTGEEIVEATAGDKENWIINGFQNLAHIKPVREGSRSNLNLLTKSGNVYSFLLNEVTPSGLEPDLKLFVEPKDEVQVKKAPRFVSLDEMEAVRREAEAAKRRASELELQAKDEVDRQVRRFRADLPLRLQFYLVRPELARPPFNVRAIFSDGAFTYIKAAPEETPLLSEWGTSQFLPLQVEYRGDLLVIPKVVRLGRLAIGKRSYEFVP